MSLKLFGIKIYISVPFAVMIAFLLITDKTGLMGASLVAVCFHEAGHIIAFKALKNDIREIECGIGGVLIIGGDIVSFKESTVTALAGPLANFICTLLFYVVWVCCNGYYLLVLAAVQLVLGVVNVLPIKGLDGGTVLYNILVERKVKCPEFKVNIISFIVAILVFVIGLAVFVRNILNPTLLLMGIYLIILNITK